MKHPGPQLADYLDGTLAPAERAAVDAHLASCAACREEVRLARAGHELAAGLPEPAAPPGIGDAAVEEARRISAERSPEVAALDGARPRPRPTTSRWVAVAGAAAAVVLIAVAAPRIGQPGAQRPGRRRSGYRDLLPEGDDRRGAARQRDVRQSRKRRSGAPKQRRRGRGRQLLRRRVPVSPRSRCPRRTAR